MLEKKNLEEFTDLLIKDVIEKSDKGLIPYSCRKYATEYDKKRTVELLNGFIYHYLYYIYECCFQKIPCIGKFIIFDEYYFPNNIDGIDFSNYFIFDETPFFSFMYEISKNEIIYGLLYYDEGSFKVKFPKKIEGDYDFIYININIINKQANILCSKTEFIDSIREISDSLNNIHRNQKKDEFISDLEEFLELVLSLNESDIDLIKPIALNLIEKAKKI